MKFRSFVSIALSIFCLGLVAACGQSKDANNTSGTAAKTTLSDDAKDIHSFARPEVARVRHVSLNLATDFDAKVISGTATLDIEAAEGASEVILDTKDLKISRVTDMDGRPLTFALGEGDAIHGQPLVVQLDGAGKIVVHYASSPGAPALQWLPPAQTAGKKNPYLFSQGQAILNRSWIPTQDSPGIRQSWDATITVPEQLTAVMSGEMLTPRGEESDGGRVFSFKMDRPVAPYLIAIAVGDLAFKEIGPRTGVWTEPSMLTASATEFADLEKMVTAAEGLYGPYRWGRYDLLVLPPSFPFGGMENPRLTFVTPTAIAGDKSLVSLIAHELAHSWSGNLVTNANWDDFWLNEGFTTYFENRIMEVIYGKDTAAMIADLGWSEMQTAAKEAGGWESPDSALHLNLAGRDPDAGMTSIAYEKGATFLRTIETTVGRARWDAYLKGYFDRFAFRPQTSSGFIADMRGHLFRPGEEEKIGVEQWVYKPGLPANAVHVKSTRFDAIDALARDFAAGKTTIGAKPAAWTTQETVRFIDSLPRTLAAEKLSALDRAWGLSQIGNSEIRFSWLMLALGNRYEPARASAEQFLLSMGRRKFVAPIYKAMQQQGEWGQPLARTIYAKARPGYHSVTVNTVDQTLGWKS